MDVVHIESCSAVCRRLSRHGRGEERFGAGPPRSPMRFPMRYRRIDIQVSILPITPGADLQAAGSRHASKRKEADNERSEGAAFAPCYRRAAEMSAPGISQALAEAGGVGSAVELSHLAG